MKKLLLAAVLVVGVVGYACAENGMSDQLNPVFTKAKEWLGQQNLNITGGPSGRDDKAAFTQEAILFYGKGVGNPNAGTPMQREQGAKRVAAEAAQRAIVEYLGGFPLVGDTLVIDVMAENDSIRSAVSGVVTGTHVALMDYDIEKDISIAIIKYGMRGPKGFGSSLYDRMLKDPELKQLLTEVDGKQAPRYTHKEVSLPERYDGLIIDATGQNFKPALINRILSSKNELLYDPSKVSQKVLVEQGCGEYTNSVQKARAALDSRGIKNPLVVKAVGTVSAADLQVSDPDAVTIFSANQKGNFLGGAKVAFVLK